MAEQPLQGLKSQSDVHCTCPPGGFSESCPWARGGVGHVKACPVSEDPCPCLPGSLAEAHCAIEARLMTAPNVPECDSPSANPGSPFGV